MEQAVGAEARAPERDVGRLGAAGRDAPAGGGERPAVQVRAERQRVAAAAGGGSERPAGRQGQRESEAGPVPDGRGRDPGAHGGAPGPDADLCGAAGRGGGASAGGGGHAGRGVQRVPQRQDDGCDAGQGAGRDDVPPVCAAGAECLAGILGRADGRGVGADLPAPAAGGGIPDVEGSGRRRVGDQHARSGHGPVLRLPGGRAVRRRGDVRCAERGGRSLRAGGGERGRADDGDRSGGDQPVVPGLDGPGLADAGPAGRDDLRMPRAGHDGASVVAGAGGAAGQIRRPDGHAGEGHGPGPFEGAGNQHDRAAAGQ